MIKLNKSFTPVCLNPDFVSTNTSKFIEDSSLRVWDVSDLKKTLLLLSNGKCAYCECYINEESKYMEVEHFADKDRNPDMVLVWDNLLPACKRCNGKKGTHDITVDCIINPCVDDPREHLQFKLGRMRGKTDLGRASVETIGLNDYKRSILPRHRIAERIMEYIDDCLVLVDIYIGNSTTRRKNMLLKKINLLLEECLPNSEYSATAATALHTDPDYIDLKQALVSQELWNEEFATMDGQSKLLVLEIANQSHA